MSKNKIQKKLFEKLPQEDNHPFEEMQGIVFDSTIYSIGFEEELEYLEEESSTGEVDLYDLYNWYKLFPDDNSYQFLPKEMKVQFEVLKSNLDKSNLPKKSKLIPNLFKEEKTQTLVPKMA